MRLKGVVAVGVAGLVALGGGLAPALAQDAKPAEEKGVKAGPIVTSLGPFREPVSIPVVLSGQTIVHEPGGQAGKQGHLVPTFIYVLEGTLTTNSEGGRVGVAGVQYHTAGQAYSDPVGVWHNHSNTGITPVKYLLLLVATPGATTTEKAKGDD